MIRIIHLQMGTNRYKDIRTVLANHLQPVMARGNEDSKRLMREIEQNVDSCAKGEIEDAEGAILTFWELSGMRGKCIKGPEAKDLNVSPPTVSFYWN